MNLPLTLQFDHFNLSFSRRYLHHVIKMKKNFSHILVNYNFIFRYTVYNVMKKKMIR